MCRICSRASSDSQLETSAVAIAASNANAAANDATANDAATDDAAAANDATAAYDAAVANDAVANDAAANDAAANDVTGSPSDVGLRSSYWICYAFASMHPSKHLSDAARPQCFQQQLSLARHLPTRWRGYAYDLD